MTVTLRQTDLVKVPAVTLLFWILKILATTLGETAGDTVSMSMDLGYLAATTILAIPLVALVLLQIRAQAFHPLLYWTTIAASTTAGTTMADLSTRSLGIGYAGGSALLLTLLLLSIFTWWYVLGTVAVDTVSSARSEAFYWITITLSQTLGTALGDWISDTQELGYLGGATLFSIGLLGLTVLYVGTTVSRVFLFWAAFVLTRPLGATLGDFLDKPLAQGGLDLSRPLASLVFVLGMAALIRLVPQQAAAKKQRTPCGSAADRDR